MGSMIELGLGHLEIDWGKNEFFRNHSKLFLETDIAPQRTTTQKVTQKPSPHTFGSWEVSSRGLICLAIPSRVVVVIIRIA